MIELLIVVAVIAIVIGFAVPNMRQMMLNNSTKAAINSLLGGLQMARNEAVARGKAITFCPSNQQGSNCGTSSGEKDYQYGALVMMVGNSEVIHRTEPTPKNVQVNNEGDSKINFQSSGTVKNTGTIRVAGQGSIKKTICIGAFGQTHTKEGIGAGVTCP
ncbi:hypothetical protein AXE65_08565 [Ventosimonas gracilis]|uniref:Type II secretion system protein H n=1 Tax=Ventosimonas gracilis TaxID=1680762 RepID=A0A139SXR9_9GAMM|nr:hypothetical protein AXE65_08565 [Ventosimonas gracilis]